MLEILSRAHILAFPSIRELGGVVLKAMALGTVPLVFHYGGPGELVSPGTGYTIPIGKRSEVAAALRDRLSDLFADPASFTVPSAATRTTVLSNFTWSAKTRQVREMYARLSS